MKSTIAKVIYLGILPAMGTYMLLFSMFHVELGYLYDTVMLSSESDTSFKLVGITMCAVTWFAAFQYWNSFVREFSVQMTEAEIDEYQEYEESYDEGYNEPEMEEIYPSTYDKVELDSPIKGLCLPFVSEYPKEEYRDRPRGWGNGYVLVSSDHPASGLGYDNELVPYFKSELTFAGQFSTEMLESCGIDKDVAKDADKYWVFGFDTMHVWNNRVTHDANWVTSEAVQLAAEFRKAFIEEVV